MTVSNLARPKSFRDDIADVLKDSDPADPARIEDLSARVYDLCERQMAPMRAEAERLGKELSGVHSGVRQGAFMLGQAEALAAHLSQQTARHAAVAAQTQDILRNVRRLAQGSFDGKVSAEDLTALVSTELMLPEPGPVQLGFFPSDQFRAGMFRSHDGVVCVMYTFVGWVNVSKFPTGGISHEPAFLVQDRGVLPASFIEAERELRLELPLLPHLREVA